jgi:hypothetical protein
MSRWIAVGAYTLFLYATLPFGRPLLNLIKGLFGSHFGLFINLILAGLGVALFVSLIRRQAPSIRRGVFLVSAGIVLAFMVSRIELVEERVHLLQYAGLGYLASRAVRPLRSERQRSEPSHIPDHLPEMGNRSALLNALGLGGPFFLKGKGVAVGIILFIGVGDEIIQWFLPSRVFDLRDILFNILGGIMGILLQASTHPKPLSS